jgi:putative hemolysin
MQREDGSWLVDGLLAIEELQTLLELSEVAPHAQSFYKTVGGFVMTTLGSIPEPSASFVWQGLRFEVMDMAGRRVDKVLEGKAMHEGILKGQTGQVFAWVRAAS